MAKKKAFHVSQPILGKKSIRASQLISPFGVGAVVELGGESFACMDITRWPSASCARLADNNLERILHTEIKRPPTDEQGAAVPLTRFPRWLFCPSCRKLLHYTHTQDKSTDFAAPECSDPECRNVALVPMRFIAICTHGHMQDVDWYWWAHRNAQASETGQCAQRTSRLSFVTTGASGGDFNAMAITCSCGARNSFETLTERPYPLGCRGRQPWQNYEQAVRCDAEPYVHPRGASNVYYPQPLSSLDIGADAVGQSMGREAGLRAWLEKNPNVASTKEAARLIKHWVKVPALYHHIVDEACREFGLPRDLVQTTVIEFIGGKPGSSLAEVNPDDQSQHGILLSEWPYLSRSTAIDSRHLRTRPVNLQTVWPRSLAAIWDQVTLVDRLREVRALLGFRRLKPDREATLVSVDLDGDAGWLPGIEQFGEGIFLRFSEPFVADWEEGVSLAFAGRRSALQAKCERWGRDPATVYSSPRFIAIHTFAHGLIRRLAFDAGYSSSSLRERIYCNSGTHSIAGVLIYTSDGDSEGSLGGLVRQGEPKRLLATVQRAIADLSWCSGDPVCSELENQGIDALNAAACHACCLLSETSCGFNNSLLDRRLLFGSQQAALKGLLEGLQAIPA